ncbi:MAG: DUF5028 domain-containing protein [Eubacteriales bacterium]|nr:DUF5028 domain-containing protein [Eubacteriales bacterium]
MKRKIRGILFCVAFFAAVLWIYGVWSVNGKYAKISEENYETGQWVNLDGCKLTEISNTEGYEIQVLGKEIVNTDILLEKYATKKEKEAYLPDTEEFSPWRPDRVYLVHVKLRNNSLEESMERGIDWQPMYLFYRNVVLDFDMQLYALLNRSAEGSSTLSLKPKTEMEFCLPYGIYKELLGKNADKINTIPLEMVLSLWPVMKTVTL